MLGNITTIGETKKKNDNKLLKYIYNFFFSLTWCYVNEPSFIE